MTTREAAVEDEPWDAAMPLDTAEGLLARAFYSRGGNRSVEEAVRDAGATLRFLLDHGFQVVETP